MEMFNNVIFEYDLFNQGSWMMPIFIVALFVAFFINKNKLYRVNLFVPSIIVLFICFNPIFINKALDHLEVGRVVRIYWTLPLLFVLAFCFVCIAFLLKSKIYRLVVSLALVVVVVFAGKYMFSGENFAVAENPYKVPNDVVEICQAIEEDGNTGKLASSEEYVEYIRQYDANINLSYGRRPGKGGSYYSVMMADVIDIEWLEYKAAKNKLDYFILDKGHEVSEAPQNHGFCVLYESDKSILYKYNE